VGSIAGAALVSHHPGLMQCEELRCLQGAGEDSDLIAGFERLRERLVETRPDVVVIFDTHWFTTGYHLVDAGPGYRGTYVSDEMPWYLKGVPYEYRGLPDLGYAIEAVSRERGGFNRAVADPALGRHYATINVIKLLRLELLDLPVVSVSSCQNCDWRAYLESGEAIGQAIGQSGYRAVLLASGALSHKFNNIDWKPNHPRIYHESNVSRPENAESDKQAVSLMTQGRHDLILDRWDEEYRKLPWEAFGAHYLQMLGALGGPACASKGTVLSDYENARGTGNIHIWFGL
jgi:3,4-dihydroxyphenylacetate 2,3-dioxygenase